MWLRTTTSIRPHGGTRAAACCLTSLPAHSRMHTVLPAPAGNWPEPKRRPGIWVVLHRNAASGSSRCLRVPAASELVWRLASQSSGYCRNLRDIWTVCGLRLFWQPITRRQSLRSPEIHPRAQLDQILSNFRTLGDTNIAPCRGYCWNVLRVIGAG
jgi:hypothetical protein